jgi:hypothetical protein
MKKQAINRFKSIDTQLENLEYSLRELQDDVAVGAISNNVNARRLEANWLKIDGIRLMLNNLKKSLDNTTTP